MRYFFLVLSLAVACCFTSCNKNQQSAQNFKADELFQLHDSILAHTQEYSDSVIIRYAKGLKVDYQPDGIHVYICNPDPSLERTTTEEFVITKPAKRFICTTALQLGNFEVLGLEDRIV